MVETGTDTEQRVEMRIGFADFFLSRRLFDDVFAMIGDSSRSHKDRFFIRLFFPGTFIFLG